MIVEGPDGQEYDVPDEASPQAIADYFKVKVDPSLTTATPPPQPKLAPGGTWSGLQNWASGELEGFGPEVSALATSIKSGYNPLFHFYTGDEKTIAEKAKKYPPALIEMGSFQPQNLPWIGRYFSPPKDTGDYGVTGYNDPYGTPYQQALDAYRARQAEYKKANPLTGVVTDVVGSTPTTMAGIATGGELLGAGTEAAFESTKLGPAAEAVSRFLGGETKGNLLARGASRATSGAIQGGTAGAIQTHMESGDTDDNVATGAKVGAAINLLTNPALAKVLAPFRAEVEPAVAAIAKGAEKLGVNLRGGQIATSPAINKLDQSLNNEGQLSDYTRALSHTFGEDTDRITPDVMASARKRLQGEFDDIAANTTITPTPDFFNRLSNVARNAYAELPSDSNELKSITRAVDAIRNEALTGSISGDTYQALTRYNSEFGKLLTSNDPNLKFYGGELKDVLDDSLAASSPAGMSDRLAQARSQFKNMLAVDSLAEKSPSGVVNPKLVLGRAQKFYRDFAEGGGGDFGTLARAGQYLPKPTIQGGVPEAGHAILGVFKGHPAAAAGAGVGLGALAASHLAEPLIEPALHMIGSNPEISIPAAAGTALAFGARAATKAAMRRNWYRNLLIQNGVTPPPGIVNPLIPGGAYTYNQPNGPTQ